MAGKTFNQELQEPLTFSFDVEYGGDKDDDNLATKKLDAQELTFLNPPSELWNKYGTIFKQDANCEKHLTLPLGVYVVGKNMEGYFLQKTSDNFEFNYKIYGVESDLIDRMIRTHKGTNYNLGVLLNGLKGTGKTVTAKQICNVLKLPVILITFNDGTVHKFVNSISQDITIFIDEYEKIFEKDAEMLTIMDGAINSSFKRIFILTTNSLRVNENLLQRPGRIRYIKTFKDLTPEIIEELIDDILINKEFKHEVFKFISNLQSITIDIAKAVLSEVNIHNELPEKFEDVFNVQKITGKYDLTIINDAGETYKEKRIDLFKSVTTNFESFNIEHYQDSTFTLYLGNNLGSINLQDTNDGEIFTATISSDFFPEKTLKRIKAQLQEAGLLKVSKPKSNAKAKKERLLISSESQPTNSQPSSFKIEVQLKITQAFSTNRMFNNYGYEFY